MSSGSVHAPVNPGDPGRGPAIIGVTWTLTSIFVAFRFYCRSQPPSRLGLDDWTILVALVIQLLHQALVTVAWHFGAGMHDEDLSLPQLIRVLMWFWISTTPAIVVSIVARISAAILLFRIFRSVSWFKWFIIVFTTLQTIIGIVSIIAIYTQAEPIQALWDPTVTPTRVRDSRFKDAIVNVAQSFFAFSDLSYVFFPVFIIFKLNMPLRRKIGLAIVLSLSFISFVGSVMKPVTANLAHDQYQSSLVIIWSNLEQTLVIMITCVPALRALAILELPIIRSISSSIASIISSSSRKGSVSTSSSQARNGWEEIGTPAQGARRRRGEGSLVGSATAIAKGESHSKTSVELGPYIQRTDQFTISYGNERKPAENV
ncbi:hypothetical protein FHL15_008782 [Xylaria flabelliformis]|uniref:Rhodopsin domain-containing protein n=1 Tax=Xylaria flabelliformis TaxID=2512241 RepID=A0A553HR38_9PEZI|nr:hypothetical protein FHL15_008782 [Xylaria flabelliformis]